MHKVFLFDAVLLLILLIFHLCFVDDSDIFEMRSNYEIVFRMFTGSFMLQIDIDIF